MADERSLEVSVLVVGAGPAGLVTALSLARYGIDCLLVERRRELSSLPRSTGISTRSMELLRSWGLEEEVRAGGVGTEWMHWFCETLAAADSGHGYPTGYPTKPQCAAISPTTPACVPQDHLEPVLLEAIRSLDAGRVQLGTEVTDVEEHADGVRAVLSDGDGSTVVLARYLVAADGAHSTVRRALGIQMSGSDQLVEAVTALFHAPLWHLVPDHHRYGIYMITHPAAEGVLRPTGGDRWDYMLMCDPGNDVAERAENGGGRLLYRRAWFGGLRIADLSERGLAERIRIAVGIDDFALRVERIAGFSFSAQVAERFRSGNVFFVGDAAHRATPRGGTGMNTALHDAHDIGWKLAWVLSDWADPELLDSYERERRPVAQHNVGLSADSRRTFQEPGQEVPADLGGRMTHSWTRWAEERVSTLDLLGRGFTLFTGPESAPWEPAATVARARLPVELRSLDVITARAIGIQPGGALLVRPDGVPAGCFAPGAEPVRVTMDAVAAIADPGALAATDRAA